MSCYNWERGTITLSAKEWSGFRKGLLEAWNKRQLELLDRAKRVHATLKAVCKGKRGKTRDAALKGAIERHIGREHDDGTEDLRNLVVKYDRAKHAYVLNGSQPQRKALKLFAVSKDADIRLPDADVHFRNKGRAVTWDVSENNRAVEHAHEHWFAKLLFERLGNITWTRGTGGKIIGNDEYNRDAGYDHEGGGGSYVNREYRALTAKEKREAEKRRYERTRYNHGLGGMRW
jgi:hypothetical protein